MTLVSLLLSFFKLAGHHPGIEHGLEIMGDIVMNDKLKYLGNVIGNSIWFVIAQTLFPF
jgi:hypothetical protein